MPPAPALARGRAESSRGQKVRYASLAARALAFIADLLVQWLCLWTIWQLIGMTGISPTMMFIAPFSLVFCWAYAFAFTASRLRATPGQRWVGLRVADRNGRRLIRPSAARRSAAALLCWISLGLPFWGIWNNRKRQAWHDEVSQAYVFQKAGSLSVRLVTPGLTWCAPVAALLGLMVLLAGPVPFAPPSVRSEQVRAAQVAVRTLEAHRSEDRRRLASLAENTEAPVQAAMAYIEQAGQGAGPSSLRWPRQLPDMAKGGASGTRLKYLAASGSIHVDIVEGELRAALMYTPIRSPTGLRWSCGVYGLSLDQLPKTCRRLRQDAG